MKMDRIRIRVLVLLVLLNPAPCRGLDLSSPIICYILDGVLILYCIIATALFFREKISHQAPTAMTSDNQEPSGGGGLYQELRGSKNADPYEVLEPFKKKREKKKKKSQAVRAVRGAEAEPVPGTSSSAPPQSHPALVI